jgi:hypothetical protein
LTPGWQWSVDRRRRFPRRADLAAQAGANPVAGVDLSKPRDPRACIGNILPVWWMHVC